jgi:transcriptional regulator with XRE-family HTH domain
VITIDAGAGLWLADQMRLWRERALLTQEQLADSTGLGVRTIRRLESRVERRPRNESIRLLAAALNLSDDELAQLVAAANGRPAQRLAGDLPPQSARDVVDFTEPPNRCARCCPQGGRAVSW